MIQLPPLGAFSVRSNPWSEEALEQIHACILRAHKLNRHLEQSIGNRIAFEADPDVMLIGAHHVANVVNAVKAELEIWDPHLPISETQKAVLKRSWECARNAEATSKKLRRDQDWKTWLAMHPKRSEDYTRAASQTRAAKTSSDQASADFHNDDYDKAVTRLYQSALRATSVLTFFGYENMDDELARAALRAYDLVEKN